MAGIEFDADEARRNCREIGGDACVDLLFASDDNEDWLLGLSCGGRGVMPCQKADPTTAQSGSAEEPDDPFIGTDLAGEYDALIRGTVVRYFIREVDRPIYGWVDETVVAYCADGSFNMQSQGERRTVLDNTEYRSDSGSGTWTVTLLDHSSVLVEHYFADGRIIRLPVSGPTSNQVWPPGFTPRTAGPASC